MFEWIERISSAWGEIKHLSEITGACVGALGVLALVIYVDPGIRKIAVRLAIAVGVAGAIAIGCYGLGAGDVRAQWNAANVRAAAAAQKRDASVAASLAAKYEPVITDLTKENTVLGNQVNAYEKTLLGAKGAKPGPCRLGAFALRLRNGK